MSVNNLDFIPECYSRLVYTRFSESTTTRPHCIIYTSDFMADSYDKYVKLTTGKERRDTSSAILILAVANSFYVIGERTVTEISNGDMGLAETGDSDKPQFELVVSGIIGGFHITQHQTLWNLKEAIVNAHLAMQNPGNYTAKIYTETLGTLIWDDLIEEYTIQVPTVIEIYSLCNDVNK